jgi:N-acetylneuraminic acid mutarotase
MLRFGLLLIFLNACSNSGSSPSDMTMSPPDLGSNGVRPPGRKSIDAVLAPTLNQLFVYGGDQQPFTMALPAPRQFVDDLWSYDWASGQWSMVATGVPPGPRGQYAAALDSKRNRILYFGGRKGATATPPLTNEIWAYDPTAKSWAQLMPTGTAPVARVGHRVAYDAAGDRLLMFGGDKADSFNAGDMLADFWELDFAASADGAWKQIAATGGPSARRDVALAIDDAHKRLVVYGGASDFATYQGDVLVFDLTAGSWKNLNTGSNAPSARFAMKMVYDAPRDKFVMFGGHDLGTVGILNDLWTFQIDAGAANATFAAVLSGDTDLSIAGVDHNSPERREKHGLERVGDKLFLYGGGGDCGPLDDTWLLDLTNPTMWMTRESAMIGESCYRRAMSGQQCPTDVSMECVAPF